MAARPTFGYDTTLTPGWNGPFIADVLEHAVLPALTHADHVDRRVDPDHAEQHGHHAGRGLHPDGPREGPAEAAGHARLRGRNAILPNLTGFAMSLGFVVGGAILIEYVFNYPGVGYMLLQAVENEDYPLMQALFLLITVAVLVAVLLADIATAIFDPRTRTAGEPWPRAPSAAPARTCPWLRRAGAICAPSAPTGRRSPALSCWPSSASSRPVPRPDRPRRPDARPTAAAWGHRGAPCSAPPPTARTSSPRLVWGTRQVAGASRSAPASAATLIAALIGVTAAYLGGADGRRADPVHRRVPRHPAVPAAHRDRRLRAAARARCVLIAVLTVHRLVVHSATAPLAGAVAAQPGTSSRPPGSAASARSYIIVVEILPTMISLIVAAFLTKPCTPSCSPPACSSSASATRTRLSWGTMLYWAENNEALQTGTTCGRSRPALCIALLGAAFALLNYAFDEIGNPALRPVQESGAGVRPARSGPVA